jgi:serine/threonine-protein kinase
MHKNLSLFDLAPGKKLFDRYTIKGAHRQGGMSVAFEAQDAQAGGACELQVFPAALFEGAAQGAEFAQALRAWAHVEAPAVIAQREIVALEGGAILLVTDFPRGASLRAWLGDNRRMEPERAIDLTLKLLDGLIEIHAADLVHGDIKPNTIFVDGGPVLLDGGITPALWSAKHLGDRTTLIGTPVYAPIEQFGGDAPSEQSDLYNLATVLFELISGGVPWHGKSFLEVFQSKLDKRPPSLCAAAQDVEISPELEAAVAAGMMADRKERCGTALEFRERLQRAADA